MTRRDILECVHEPFGDAFYFGPERLSERYEKDADAREASGFSQTTYRGCLRHIETAGEKVRTAQSPFEKLAAKCILPYVFHVPMAFTLRIPLNKQVPPIPTRQIPLPATYPSRLWTVAVSLSGSFPA